MVMPFLRLLAIYAVVIIAITAFFQRDRIMDLVGYSPRQSVEIEAEASDGATTDGTAETDSTTRAATVATAVAESVTSPEQPSTEPKANDDRLPIVMPVADEPAIAEPSPAATASANPVPVARPAATTDVAKALNEARKAYWQGDIPGAERQYRGVLQNRPNHTDANVELGHILYGQRRFDDAANYYFAAGKILIANGNSDQALPLFHLLQGIAPQRAAELHTLATQ